MKKILVVLLAAFLSFATGQTAAVAAATTVAITHGMGTTTVPVNPGRVVVMDYGSLDTLDYLIGAGAVSPDISLALPKQHLPAYLKKYADGKYVNTGSLKDFNMETVASFKPDLIIISLRQQDFYKDLSAIAPVVLFNNVPAPYWEGVIANIRNMGTIFGARELVEKAIARLEDEAVKTQETARAKNYRGLVLLTNDGKISAYGSGSRFGIIHDKLGVGQADTAIKVGTHGQMVNYEYIALRNPDIIFVVDRSVAVGGKADGARILRNELTDSTNAARNGRIVSLDPSIWYLSGGGIESLGMMVSTVRESVEK